MQSSHKHWQQEGADRDRHPSYRPRGFTGLDTALSREMEPSSVRTDDRSKKVYTEEEKLNANGLASFEAHRAEINKRNQEEAQRRGTQSPKHAGTKRALDPRGLPTIDTAGPRRTNSWEHHLNNNRRLSAEGSPRDTSMADMPSSKSSRLSIGGRKTSGPHRSRDDRDSERFGSRDHGERRPSIDAPSSGGRTPQSMHSPSMTYKTASSIIPRAAYQYSKFQNALKELRVADNEKQKYKQFFTSFPAMCDRYEGAYNKRKEECDAAERECISSSAELERYTAQLQTSSQLTKPREIEDIAHRIVKDELNNETRGETLERFFSRIVRNETKALQREMQETREEVRFLRDANTKQQRELQETREEVRFLRDAHTKQQQQNADTKGRFLTNEHATEAEHAKLEKLEKAMNDLSNDVITVQQLAIEAPKQRTDEVPINTIVKSIDGMKEQLANHEEYIKEIQLRKVATPIAATSPQDLSDYATKHELQILKNFVEDSITDTEGATAAAIQKADDADAKADNAEAKAEAAGQKSQNADNKSENALKRAEEAIRASENALKGAGEASRASSDALKTAEEANKAILAIDTESNIQQFRQLRSDIDKIFDDLDSIGMAGSRWDKAIVSRCNQIIQAWWQDTHFNQRMVEMLKIYFPKQFHENRDMRSVGTETQKLANTLKDRLEKLQHETAQSQQELNREQLKLQQQQQHQQQHMLEQYHVQQKLQDETAHKLEVLNRNQQLMLEQYHINQNNLQHELQQLKEQNQEPNPELLGQIKQLQQQQIQLQAEIQDQQQQQQARLEAQQQIEKDRFTKLSNRIISVEDRQSATERSQTQNSRWFHDVQDWSRLHTRTVSHHGDFMSRLAKDHATLVGELKAGCKGTHITTSKVVKDRWKELDEPYDEAEGGPGNEALRPLKYGS
ncbi:hypothetical protein EDC01DRAFT_175027 [Geopyxis carbonaria]|nr:hypothetical protein EDC01DRAFT_175027 [Geopyxis carbonaria]